MIISAHLSQLDEIVSIENSSFEKPWTRNQIKGDIQANISSKNWVYTLDGKVVGYIFGWISQNKFHLHNIAVHPDHLRKNWQETHQTYNFNSCRSKSKCYFIRGER